MFNYTTVVSVEISHMSEFITPRKRKSDIIFNETIVKKNNLESCKPESTPKKIIRRLSTKFKIFTPSKVVKSRYQIDEDVLGEECENNQNFLSGPTSVPESTKCSSITYFVPQFLKKNGSINDSISNNRDTSRQSSTGAQHLMIGIDLFNRDLKCGIEYMQINGLIDSDEELAKLFIKKKGFNKMKLFEFLTMKENCSIHKCFCNQLDLKFKTIPEVLTEYLKHSFISGEYNTMLGIVDVLSHAYMDQHKEGAIMGLNVNQIITISQYLIAFNANEQKEKIGNRLSRETFIEYLQNSLTEENKISRQLASCLYMEISETPLVTMMDERSKNLDKVRRMLTNVPKEFGLVQHHRYIICHVDLSKVVLPLSVSEKPSFHDRTLFLFNDVLIVTKKNWSYDSNSYRVKQIISLSQVTCSMVTCGALTLVKIGHLNSSETVLNIHSQLLDDLMSFYSNLEHTIATYRILLNFQKEYYKSRESA